MLIKDLINVDVKFISKASKLLDLNTKDFFIQLKTIQCSTNYKQDFLDEVCHVLNKLSEIEIVKLSPDNSTSGIPLLDDIKDEFVIPSTKSSLLRRGKSMDVINHSDTHPSSDIVKSSSVPFDTYLALKYISKQQNAIQRGLEFTLTLSDMKRLIKTKRCHFSGVSLELEGDLKLTLDRIDSNKGYTASNTVACTKVVNDIKNELLDNGVNLDKLGKSGLKKMLIKLSELL